MPGSTAPTTSQPPAASAMGGLDPLAAMGGFNPLAAMGGFNPLAATGGFNPLAAMGGSNPLAAAGGFNPLAAMGGSNPLAAAGGFNPLAAAGGLDPLQAARLQEAAGWFAHGAGAAELSARALSRQLSRISRDHGARARRSFERLRETGFAQRAARGPAALAGDLGAYAADAARRGLLTLDALRARGDVFFEHEAAGCPPVLTYDHEIVLDGADLPHPCNYVLLRILPPEGAEVLDWKRPYVIIDPRAGHGAGIGGFKADSQVGVALRDGHPVYFVSFRRDPVPGQTLAHVTRAEAAFIREVKRRHPQAANPVVTGNCQGGWATLLLAAANPDVTGPIVINGAPVATWAGEVGENPMRYNAGILGGTWQPMFWSDLGGGVFDGAHLVMNFETLNPGRSFFRKYYDLYQDPTGAARARFLEFEKWWGGFFLLNEAEIRWIVEQLFVGNRVAKNEARLEPGRPIDVKAIRAPVIIFASHGDNITPPQQALNWILDTYADANEIRIRGQRIVYILHEEIGHLGIFVSSKIARREHTEVTSTLKTIEALAPGLYEMKIDEVAREEGREVFTVSFHERTLEDVAALDDGRDDEAAFAAVARASEMQASAYELFARPVVQAGASAQAAALGRKLHPMRLQRALISSRNPLLAPLASAAEAATRLAPPAPDNPFLAAERIWADMVEQSLDWMRDMRDLAYEQMFFAIWNTPWAQAFGRSHQPRRTLKTEAELRALPEVQAALRNMSRGGFVEAVIRMLILLAESRGAVRRDRLERSARVLTQDEPFRSMSAQERQMTIHEQTLIAQFEPERAVETLPDLLASPEERALAFRVVRYVPGALKEMAPHTIETLERFQAVLGLPAMAEEVRDDPIAEPGATRALKSAGAADADREGELTS